MDSAGCREFGQQATQLGSRAAGQMREMRPRNKGGPLAARQDDLGDCEHPEARANCFCDASFG